MSETPATTATSPAPAGEPKPYWLYRLAAWVVIVAGIVFIVSSIFFAGVWASRGGPGGPPCHGPHGPHGHPAMFHKAHHHHRGPGPQAPDDRPGPGELPPSVVAPAPPTPSGR